MTSSPTPKPSFTPSRYQAAIGTIVKGLKPRQNIAVNAVAGSGKTTTLTWSLSLLPKHWQAQTLVAAFNKAIQEELEKRVPQGVTCKTSHSIGMLTLRTGVNPKDSRNWVDKNKSYKLIKLYWERRLNWNPEEPMTEAMEEMVKLIHFVKVFMVDPTNHHQIFEITAAQDLPLSEAEVQLEALPVIIDWGINGLDTPDDYGRTYGLDDRIDFDDMLYGPWVKNLQPKRYRVVLVDECQDLSPLQLWLMKASVMPIGNLMFFGDPRQAIYAFAGADSQSFDNIVDQTNATVMPLSICYRCSTSVVNVAQQIVPYLEASPSAPTGAVYRITDEDFIDHVNPGDMVLCRTNAELISYAFKLISQGKRAKVKGRDIGASILKIIKEVERAEGFTFKNFGLFLEQWRSREIQAVLERENHEELAIRVNDRADSVLALLEGATRQGAKNLQAVKDWISEIFARDDEKGNFILLSSIHKAKGLEAKKVYLLRADKLPHPMARSAASYQQETNLAYVAITRAMEQLIIVGDPSSLFTLPGDLPVKSEA